MDFSYNSQNQLLSWLAQDGYYQIGQKVNGIWSTIYSGLNTSMQINLDSGNHILARKTSDPNKPPIPPTPAEYQAIAETLVV